MHRQSVEEKTARWEEGTEQERGVGIAGRGVCEDTGLPREWEGNALERSRRLKLICGRWSTRMGGWEDGRDGRDGPSGQLRAIAQVGCSGNGVGERLVSWPK